MKIADDETLLCLLSHKCSDNTHSLADRLTAALSEHCIKLLIDPFRYGDDFNARMQTFEFDALLFLLAPESWDSKPCQMELRTARHRDVPIFTALLEGNIPTGLKRRLSWKLSDLSDMAFAEQICNLADAIRIRVSLYKEVCLLDEAAPSDVTIVAAMSIAEAEDRTVIAELAPKLAKRYRRINDPTTCFWIALALGRASTKEAARLLRALPQKRHPYPNEGVRQALDMIARGE